MKIDEVKNCFEQWKKHLDRCIASNGDYFENDGSLNVRINTIFYKLCFWGDPFMYIVDTNECLDRSSCGVGRRVVPGELFKIKCLMPVFFLHILPVVVFGHIHSYSPSLPLFFSSFSLPTIPHSPILSVYFVISYCLLFYLQLASTSKFRRILGMYLIHCLF